jgi:predicted transcriptional regulator
MTPRARLNAPTAPSRLVRPAPEDEAEIRAALADPDEGRALTQDELQRLAETGEWPAWCDSSD